MSWVARLINVFRSGKSLRRHRSRARVPSRRTRRRSDRRRRPAGGRAPRSAAAPRQLHAPAREHSRTRPVRLARIVFRRPALRPARARLDRSSAATTILTLAIGIGANTTVFTLLHGLLLRSLPVAAPEELVRIDLVSHTVHARPAGMPLRHAQADRRQQRTFVGLSAWSAAASRRRSRWRRCGCSMPRPSSPATPSTLIGLHARLGRLLTSSDDVAAVRRKRGRSSSAIAIGASDSTPTHPRSARRSGLSANPSGRLGVTPASFHGVWPGFEPKMYLPLHYHERAFRRKDFVIRGAPFGFTGIGRLKPGLSVSDARADLMVHDRR